MTEWTKLVSSIYKQKSASNPNYKLKDAMKDAKKVYKKNKTKKGGNLDEPVADSSPVQEPDPVADEPVAKGGSKKRKNKTMKKKKGGDVVSGKQNDIVASHPVSSKSS
jgi:hypothetical protein